MKRKKEYFVLALAIVSVMCLGVQILKPQWFTGTSAVMYIIGGTQLDNVSIYNTARVIAIFITLISVLGMLLFALSVYRGNIKGRLQTSYFVLLIHTVITIVVTLVMQRVLKFNNHDSKLNVTVYFLSILILAVILGAFVLREHGGIRMIPNLSSVMLLVVLGQFVSNGLFVDNIVKIRGVLYGIMAAFPYLTIFIFEKFILEPTMKRYR